MQTFFKMMHTKTARLVRALGGLWLVIYAAQLPAISALPLALVGTALAVAGIADMCLIELVVNAAVKRRGPQRRAA